MRRSTQDFSQVLALVSRLDELPTSVTPYEGTLVIHRLNAETALGIVTDRPQCNKM